MNSLFRLSRTALQVALAGALMVGATTGAQAADAITFQGWGGGAGATPDLAAGGSLSVTKTLSKSNYSDNPALMHSAWAHAGGTPWYTFYLTSLADVTINLTPTIAGTSFNPGLTVWASGSTRFDGGTGNGNGGTEVANNGWTSPHSFNAVGQIGDNGTLWQAMGSGGNQKETLAYAITGPSHTDTASTGWGESIQTGFHDVSVTNTFESGVTGTADAGANWLSVTLHQAKAGWYTLFVGGTNNSLSAASYDLKVAAVPEPETWGMLLAGLGVMGAIVRRRRLA
jgi:hypothetical protein